MRERREEYLRAQAQSGQDVKAFFETLPERLGGRRIQLLGSVGQLYDMAVAGLANGMEGVFAPDSLIVMGGGSKGREMPEGWHETICRFLGVPDIRDGYGMTEMSMSMRSCPHGHYHMPPVYVLFILDSKTGEQQPRTGVQEGRLGFYDLTRTDLWGGFLTGDAVTLHWGDITPCACGRRGAYLTKSIRRYSQEEGGDDKITCAGAPQAHDNALARIHSSEKHLGQQLQKTLGQLHRLQTQQVGLKCVRNGEGSRPLGGRVRREDHCLRLPKPPASGRTGARSAPPRPGR